jgi:hypothetical protein
MQRAYPLVGSARSKEICMNRITLHCADGARFVTIKFSPASAAQQAGLACSALSK